jgi:SAM-dependent methyltransferase
MAGVRRALFHFYWKLEQWLVPGLSSSQNAYYKQVAGLMSKSPVWLDVGCGHQVFADWMTREQDEVIGKSRHVFGIDLDWEGMRKHPSIHDKVMGNLAFLPFASGSFDVVSANMVAEHLDEPLQVLREVHRVLAPGGTFIFHTPNAKGWFVAAARMVPESAKKPLIRLLENRRAEDVFPTRYLLNQIDQIEVASAQAGFESAQVTHVSSSAITAVLGPLVMGELLWIRALEKPSRARLRSNLVVQLHKRA